MTIKQFCPAVCSVCLKRLLRLAKGLSSAENSWRAGKICLTDAAIPDLIFEHMLKKKLSGIFVLLLVAFATLSAGCSSDTDSGSPQAPGAPIGGSDAPPLFGTQKQSGGA